MSKIFGLNWRKYDYARMQYFISMIKLENEVQEKKHKQYGQKRRA